jgi:hypothetical protein
MPDPEHEGSRRLFEWVIKNSKFSRSVNRCMLLYMTPGSHVGYPRILAILRINGKEISVERLDVPASRLGDHALQRGEPVAVSLKSQHLSKEVRPSVGPIHLDTILCLCLA